MENERITKKTNEDVAAKSLAGPLLAIILGMFMVSLDGSVLNVAMPGMVKYFGSNLSTMQWTITGYALALAAIIPLVGWVTDRFGAKSIFILVIGLFTIGSFLCSLATSPEQLIIFRIIQGIGGGMVIPIGLATIYRIAPKEKLGSLMGLLGMPLLLAPAIGPVVSGYILQYASWQWIFRINIPIGIIAILVNIRYLPDFKKKTVPSFDIWGMLLAPIAFAMLVYGVNEGAKSWTSINTIAALTIGSISLVTFIFVELRQKQPLIELKVFGSSQFTRGIIVLWTFQIVLFSILILAPLFLQYVKGYSSLQTGFMLLPQALAMCIMMPISGRLFDKVGAKPLAFIGTTIATVVLFMLSRVTNDTSVTYIVLCLVVIGVAGGLTVMSLNTHVLNAAPENLINRVTPLTGAFQQIILSFAIVIMTGFLTSRTTYRLANTANKLNAVIFSYDDTFLLCSCIAVIGIIMSLTINSPKVKVE
ncbi:MDR family MFS transporter [Clostridium pasteurianum]|uniref:Drug resistance transporter, EmrB/QacA subfamily n=1 Tax=Clostridium pasteurianum BC1 TaxID=86416 RepID=R4K5U7_CLOPA|nr:MDR family MFS transporter [Clostridium pasteurianum]AGK98527.1 drug resistance transporter, EmrB/QacA subfamily [Clostridium pasteurianum BC1]